MRFVAIWREVLVDNLSARVKAGGGCPWTVPPTTWTWPVVASYAHGYIRGLIALTEQLQHPAPPGVHTAAATLAAWILDLDHGDERLRRAPRLLVDWQWR